MSADGQHSVLAPTQRALLHRLACGQVDGRLPSIAAVVVRDQAIAWYGARGTVDGEPPTADTQYRIGSLTKTFVTIAVLRLRDEGRLRLTDRLDDHVPGTTVGTLRIGELLAHTSGLESDPPGPWWERASGQIRAELTDVLGHAPLRQPAGRRFHYSNVGYAMLGALVGQIRGRLWYEVVRNEILRPLGLARTSVNPEPPCAQGWAVHPWADLVMPEPAHDAGLMSPAGGFWSTAGDLSRFAAFLAGGASDVLSDASLEEMREPAAPGSDADHTASYGLGLQLERSGDRTLYGHCGSVPGFISALWVSNSGTASAALANATSMYPIGALAADLIGVAEEHEPAIPPEWRPTREARPDMLSVTGTWYWGPIPHVLRLHAGNELSLTLVSGRDLPTRFGANADGTWTGRNGYHAGETLRLMTRSDGSVSHLDIGTYIYTREPYDESAPIPGGTDPAGWRSA
jgi:CubicO group peptidase (beta-lactamase class C family)